MKVKTDVFEKKSLGENVYLYNSKSLFVCIRLNQNVLMWIKKTYSGSQ